MAGVRTTTPDLGRPWNVVDETSEGARSRCTRCGAQGPLRAGPTYNRVQTASVDALFHRCDEKVS